MKNFFKTIGSSFYSNTFYKSAKDKKTSEILVFLVKFSVVLGFCISIVLVVVFLAFSPSIKKEVLKFVDKNYPEGVEVTIKDGKMTTNTEVPVLIKTPVSEEDKRENEKVKENMIAILPNEKAEISILEKYNTYVGVASDGLIIENEGKGEIRTFRYGKYSNVFTKDSSLLEITKILKKGMLFVAIFIIPTTIIISLVILFSHLVWLFFIALFIFVFFRIRKINLKYWESYRIGMYAIIPLMLFELVAIPFRFSGRIFSLIVILAVVIFSTFNWQKETTAVVEEPKN